MVLGCDRHLAECLNDVEGRDEETTVNGADYLVLVGERVGIWNNHLIETSKVNYGACLIIVPNHKHRPSA